MSNTQKLCSGIQQFGTLVSCCRRILLLVMDVLLVMFYWYISLNYLKATINNRI